MPALGQAIITLLRGKVNPKTVTSNSARKAKQMIRSLNSFVQPFITTYFTTYLDEILQVDAFNKAVLGVIIKLYKKNV